jgi:hypothetical protein
MKGKKETGERKRENGNWIENGCMVKWLNG